MKNLLIILLGITNVALVIIKIPSPQPSIPLPAPQIESRADFNYAVELTVNRVFHAQIAGQWPEIYGNDVPANKIFEDEMWKAKQEGINDWGNFKP